MKTLPLIMRRCAFTKQWHPRKDMIRFVRLPNGNIVQDENETYQGRSVHIANTESAVALLKNPKKIPYLAHLLRVPVQHISQDILKISNIS